METTQLVLGGLFCYGLIFEQNTTKEIKYVAR